MLHYFSRHSNQHQLTFTKATSIKASTVQRFFLIHGWHANHVFFKVAPTGAPGEALKEADDAYFVTYYARYDA